MNIFFSYDFLTTQSHVGKRGLERFDFLFNILKKLNIDVRLDTNLSHNFPIKRFYELHHKIYQDQILNYIEPNRNCVESRHLVEDYLSGCDIFIGYELSEKTRTYFDRIGVCYIDIWLSPLRFCKDVLFSFFSNNHDIQNKFISYKTKKEFFHNEVKILKRNFNFLSNDSMDLIDDSALLISQLFVDKACQRGDQFLSFLDFKSELTEISSSFPTLYLLKHPLMPDEDFVKVIEGLKYLKNVVYLQNKNVYELLSNSKIKSVIAVSSSVLKEASYFGKKTICLYRPTLHNGYCDIYQSFFNSEFWTELLDLKFCREHWIYFNCDNYLRQKFNAFYAYRPFVEDLFSTPRLQKSDVAYNNLVTISALVDSLTLGPPFILWGFGSVGRLIFPSLKSKIKGVIDHQLTISNISVVEGIPVINIDDLEDSDLIVLSAFKYIHEVKTLLSNKDISCEVIPLF
ncbi:MAG: hypothetical protein NWQ54_00090 [Paraglaciecola sp.]|uniref:hypothetical protein n=1 Tax=Paraglaciecola sp. TaxID=1920173 RepID=UPI00273D156E|nr:hypothetical protein [Paraglaciecola sp.]MDP5030351.1 hypothetical protein [Paraglaciecola sp.]MDP5129247.1 hypothetical protein [Paraglaciecola sp.]